MKRFKTVLAVTAVMLAVSTAAWATPSRHVWIPSTDVQPMGTFRLGVDTYTTMFRKEDKGAQNKPINYGLTYGFALLPLERQVNVEVGVDLREPSDYPVLFNGKVGIPEGAWGEYMPAIAIGAYEFGVEKNNPDYRKNTDANIIYGLAAKTFPEIGRISAGYYTGNGGVLRNVGGKTEKSGLLISWDRQMTEISDKLWVGVDYQEGHNKYGATSFGVSWAFTDSTSVLLGYQIYNDTGLMGKDTVTVQVDIDF